MTTIQLSRASLGTSSVDLLVEVVDVAVGRLFGSFTCTRWPFS